MKAIYFIFGYWVRRDACRLAAQAAQGQCGDGPVAQRLWSLCVFFENYLIGGAEETRDDFGYKDPVTLADAKSDDASNG
jgi:hypothetical protein